MRNRNNTHTVNANHVDFLFRLAVGQMFLMNKFFDGEFWTFGLDVIAHMEADQEDRMDPMIYIFPRMTKCTFYKYGVSGEVSAHSTVFPIFFSFHFH